MPVTSRQQMTRKSLLRMLEALEGSNDTVVSLYFPPGVSISTIREAIKDLPGIPDSASELDDIICNSKTGAALFYAEGDKLLLIVPPLPLQISSILSGCRTEPIRSILHEDYTIALVLLHLGKYAIGVFSGEKLITGKVGTGLVHSRHKKGGSSQGRFKRHREKQMETFFSRVCEQSVNRLEPYADQIQYLIYGGEKTTVLSFRRQCQYLERFDPVTVERLLNVRELKQSNLKQAISEALKSQVIEWHPYNLEE